MAYNSTVGLSLTQGKPYNYALNGKIMLCSVIILFLVVVLIACFHSYARWWFCRRSRVHRFCSSSSGNKGLTLSLLENLPTFVYPPTHQPTPDCAVCLSEIQAGERGRVLPKCNHAFHVECIDMWFESHSNCPLCRTPAENLDVQIKRPRNSFEKVVVVGEPAEDQMGRLEVSLTEDLAPIWCGRKPEELAGITVEIPAREKSYL